MNIDLTWLLCPSKRLTSSIRRNISDASGVLAAERLSIEIVLKMTKGLVCSDGIWRVPMTKILNALIVLAVLICSSGVTTSAQLPGSCWHYGTGLAGPIYPGAFNCVPDGIGSWTCMFWSITCPPPAAPQETCPICPNGNPKGGAPISLVTGNTFIEENDVNIPGLSNGLKLTRIWNSKWPSSQTSFQTGIFGPNWRSTYEERIFLGSDNFVKYARSDGSFWSFAGSGSLTAVAPSNVVATLTADSGYTQWTLTFQNGEQRKFSYASGWLTAIVDRNGNATQLTYDSLNRLVTVADPGGRHLYFSYANNSSYLVTSVTSDVGISLSYTYDSQGRLTQVTQPDLTTLSFAYDSGSRITTVTDSAGKVLESHTYDSQGRGLTSSRANGVETVTASYPSQ
jgi:YD repeat-containing protein